MVTQFAASSPQPEFSGYIPSPQFPTCVIWEKKKRNHSSIIILSKKGQRCWAHRAAGGIKPAQEKVSSYLAHRINCVMSSLGDEVLEYK